MAIQCNIMYTPNGEIDYVETDNGQRSQLFDDLTETLGGDKNSALEFYALTDSEDFKTINPEPTVAKVLEYATSTTKELTKEQQVDLYDVIMGMGVNDSSEVEELLKTALEKDGVITFNKSRMISSGAFNSFEVEEILKSAEKQREIREIYKALKNTDVFEAEYPKDFVYTEGVELNSFGKQKIKNPYILQQEIIESQEIPEGVKDISYVFEEVVNIPQKVIVEEQLADKTTGADTKTILENTLIDEENVQLAENINFITDGFSAFVWENNKDKVATIAKQIKEQAKNNGLDLKNIEEKIFTKSRQQIIDFFESMEYMLETGNVELFAENYNEMFDLNTPLTKPIKTDSEFDVVLEDSISEYEVFSKYGLLKKAPNIYRKVEDMNIEDMYSIAATNENKTVDEVRKEVQGNPLDVTDFEVDGEVLEKMQLYKNYFNFPKTFPNVYEERQSKEYVQEANKWLLKSGNPYFKITTKGLELISEDPITREKGNLTLPEKLKLEEKPLDKRAEAYNNPLSIPKLKADHFYVNDLVVAVKNTTENFIRTPKGVFELIYTRENVSFYGLLESTSEKPLNDVNFNNFDYLTTSPEVFKKVKTYYSKGELEKIEEENFNCE